MPQVTAATDGILTAKIFPYSSSLSEVCSPNGSDQDLHVWMACKSSKENSAMHTLLLPSICAMSSCNVHADESTFSDQFTSIDDWTHWKFPLTQTLSIVLLGTRSYSVEEGYMVEVTCILQAMRDALTRGTHNKCQSKARCSHTCRHTCLSNPSPFPTWHVVNTRRRADSKWCRPPRSTVCTGLGVTLSK